MPALISTEHRGEVVWIGYVATNDRSELSAEESARVSLTFSGLPAGVHTGLTRPSCTRVKALYAGGTEIRNVRQLSIVSQEELDAIADALDIGSVEPSRLGASLVLKGIPDLTHIPPSSRLQCDATGTTLTVDMENLPCGFPAKSLEAAHPGKGKGFRVAAKGRRGITAWVEREGPLALGAHLRLYIPAQRPWAGA